MSRRDHFYKIHTLRINPCIFTARIKPGPAYYSEVYAFYNLNSLVETLVVPLTRSIPLNPPFNICPRGLGSFERGRSKWSSHSLRSMLLVLHSNSQFDCPGLTEMLWILFTSIEPHTTGTRISHHPALTIAYDFHNLYIYKRGYTVR